MTFQARETERLTADLTSSSSPPNPIPSLISSSVTELLLQPHLPSCPHLQGLNHTDLTPQHFSPTLMA